MFNIKKIIIGNRSIEKIKNKQLKKFLSEHSNIVIIDVRSRQEYDEGHIKNSINIPVYEIDKKIESIIKDKKQKILLYCLVGSRSKRAAEILEKKGYENIYNLEDGINF